MNKMGFGFLRLPGADPKTGEGIDFALLDRMVDDFLARGERSRSAEYDGRQIFGIVDLQDGGIV